MPLLESFVPKIGFVFASSAASVVAGAIDVVIGFAFDDVAAADVDVVELSRLLSTRNFKCCSPPHIIPLYINALVDIFTNGSMSPRAGLDAQVRDRAGRRPVDCGRGDSEPLHGRRHVRPVLGRLDVGHEATREGVRGDGVGPESAGTCDIAIAIAIDGWSSGPSGVRLRRRRNCPSGS